MSFKHKPLSTRKRNLIWEHLSTKKCPRGVTAIFIRTSTLKGAKLFTNYQARNTAYKLQKKAAKHGIAPKVYDCFRITYGAIRSDNFFRWENECEVDFYTTVPFQLWGYETEVVEVPTKKVKKHELDVLTEKLKEIGFSVHDLHEDNVGRNKRSKLVCVDFDPVSMDMEWV